MPTSPFGQAASIVFTASLHGGKPSLAVSELVALVVSGSPPSRYLSAANLSALVSAQQDNAMLQVSDSVVLVSYAEESVERLNSRAWGFTFDQHHFYVLHLGEQGTFVFDMMTSEWAKWKTAGYTTWNAEHGLTWNNEVYFADRDAPTLWKFDPDSYIDEDFRLITRVVTGGIPMEARRAERTGMFILSATLQGTIDDESTPYVQLSYSDDAGQTFKNRDPINITGSAAQDFSWRSNGIIKTPGRVFKITDQGAFVTIKGANQKLASEDEDG